ncbi:MAG: transporter substrate-binding domain-containing protein [Rhodospirillales bacterium]|jgi:polar amino acid transport system substrate-binding protein
MDKIIVEQLAPTGSLRAAINLGNFLLVTDKAQNGDPIGVSPDMASAIAKRLGVPVKFVPMATPGEISDTANQDIWDIGNIGAEPKRAEVMDFTAAYAEIQSTYLVPAGSPIQRIEDVDKKGVRIAVSARSAYDLWLDRNIKNAELCRAEGIEASFKLFVDEGMEVLAGLRPRLIDDVKRLDGARILEGQFSSVQQAVGCGKGRPEAAAFLKEFVEEAKRSGFVGERIKAHGVEGRLSVAPLS